MKTGKTQQGDINIENLSRRKFLKGSAVAGGGLILGFTLPLFDKRQIQAAGSEDPSMENPLPAWVRVDQQGVVEFVVPCSEMGQGSQTALAQIMADEIGADYATIRVINPINDPAYNNPSFGMQLTGGSTAVRGWWVPLRKVGATLRGLLIQAAANEWQVDPASCRLQRGVVSHVDSGRRLPMGALVDAAAALPVPENPVMRPSAEYQYIGQPMARVDTPAKVGGQAVFGIDVVRPNMLTATVMRSPVFGGKLERMDKAAALATKGVKAVVEVPNGVAVVADSYWRAHKGLQALTPTFSGGKTAGLDSAAIERGYHDALDANDGKQAFLKGSPKPSGDVIEAEYWAPYLAHTTMEPMNATAHVTETGCEIWAPTQSQSLAAAKAAEVTGLAPENIRLHTTYLGGGFGRRAEVDYVEQAVIVARELGVPVKLVWSREEDTRQDVYRPAALSRFRVSLDAQGKPAHWINRLATSSIMGRFAPQWVKDIDHSMAEGADETPYAIANQITTVVRHEPGVPVGFWRSVGHSQNCFFFESMLDECAHQAGADPVAYRRALLQDSPRALGVLDAVVNAAGWGKTLPPGHGVGIALSHSFGSYAAEVAQVSVDDAGSLKVEGLWCAIDCGLYVNPAIVERQMQSAMVYGLTAVLTGKIDFKDGAVAQSNFHDYPALGIAQTPPMHVHIVESDEDPGGYGEPGLPPLAPAVTNAIFAATGKRVRRLPLIDQDLRA